MVAPITTAARKVVVEKLLKRDYDECFYCGVSLTDDTRTIEHIVSRAAGGTHHLDNLVLACESCNNEVAALPIAEKIRLRDRKRREADRLPRDPGDDLRRELERWFPTK